jgi:3-hydroxyisobutyrate dehydrogenase-like beta-hydroxyacid dehydrogenase
MTTGEGTRTATKIAERAATYGLLVFDAPVSDGGSQALASEPAIMVGGDAEALADVADPLSTLPGHVVHLGEIGAGPHAKLINN